jgi:flagellar L-ring protein precursor FlgH
MKYVKPTATIRPMRRFISTFGMRMGMLAVAVSLLQACATMRKDEASYAPTRPQPEMLAPATQGAIFQAGREISLFEDAKARRVGDIITVVLVEQTTASKKADTNTSKKQDTELDNPTILGAPLSFNMPGGSNRDLNLGTTLTGSRSFAGSGDSSQSNKLQGNVTVTVAEVLSNGNLLVRGEKRLTINQGDEYIRLSGIVRPTDIGPDNTVLSTSVADAKISYVGKGTLDDSNSSGWLASFFNSKWWPF